MLQFLIPTVIYLPYFPIFCIGSSTMHNAVSVQCPYSFVVHISNEYWSILMSGSYVLSSDCIAAVEYCITLSAIHGDWTGTEADFFSPSLISFLCQLIMNPPFSIPTYHCTLWCVAALTRQHIITSSTFNFWASLADDTRLFTHQSFDFQFIILLPQKIFMGISFNCLFCIMIMKLQ